MPQTIFPAFSFPRPSSPRARRLGLLGALAGASLLLVACDQAFGQTDAAAPAQAPQPPEVTVAEPLVDSVEVTDEVVGRFEAVQSVEIRAQVSGRLAQVHFRDGQDVAAGDPLFTIDPAPFAAAAALAEAEEARALAQLALARDEAERSETLVGRNAISQEEHERRMRTVESAEAAARGAQARLESARIDLGYTQIAAPIDGRVSDRRIDEGNLVAAGDTLLTTLVSQDPIHVAFAVAPEIADALRTANVTRGAPVRIKLENETEFGHEGRIDFVDNQVDPRSGVVRMRAIVDNPDGRFAPGQFVRVRFTKERIEDALLVPETAVGSDQSFKYVLVVNEQNVIEPRPIMAGPVIDGLRVVHGGLGGSDRVIVEGLQRAYPGQPVTPTPGEIAVAAR